MKASLRQVKAVALDIFGTAPGARRICLCSSES